MPDPLLSEFGERLRELRRERGISQNKLVRRMDIDHVAIWRIEKGLREPRLKMILRLAKALGVPPEALLEGLTPLLEPPDRD